MPEPTPGRVRPPLNTQARIVYDHAEEWHDNAQHPGDVRDCFVCRQLSPYRVTLGIFFPKGDTDA